MPSTSELESEASMSEASSEDLVPPLEAAGAPDRDKEEALKKKKSGANEEKRRLEIEVKLGEE